MSPGQGSIGRAPSFFRVGRRGLPGAAGLGGVKNLNRLGTQVLVADLPADIHSAELSRRVDVDLHERTGQVDFEDMPWADQRGRGFWRPKPLPLVATRRMPKTPSPGEIDLAVVGGVVDGGQLFPAAVLLGGDIDLSILLTPLGPALLMVKSRPTRGEFRYCRLGNVLAPTVLASGANVGLSSTGGKEGWLAKVRIDRCSPDCGVLVSWKLAVTMVSGAEVGRVGEGMGGLPGTR